MPRKIPKWRQNRSVSNQHTLKAKVAIQKRLGVGPEQIARLKREARSDEFFDLLSGLSLSQEQVAQIQGKPFPSTLKEVFSTPLSSGGGVLANEIIWAVTTILLNGKRIKNFVCQKELFELAIISNDKVSATNILAGIEGEFGWSVWYMQNTLANAQYQDGVEEKRRLAAVYDEQVYENVILSTLLRFMEKRIEGTAVPGYLQGELASIYEGAAYRYFKAKLFDLELDIDTLALVLSLDSYFCAIDHYESLISTLQTMAVSEELTATLASILSRPVQSLFRSTSDKRLIPILIAFGITDTYIYTGVPSRTDFIEAYSEGKYEEALRLADAHLSMHADDMGTLVMRVRAELKINSELKKHDGVLGEVVQHLRNIISLNADTYSSALSLYTLHDRFYGHSWITFLRGVVNLELASDKIDYPSVALRRLVVLESRPTPFTALLQSSSNKKYHLIEYFLRRGVFSPTHPL